MKFNPHETYDGLKVQANALNMMVDSLQEQLSYYMAECRKLRDQKRHVSQDELDSERKANELLTLENEQLRLELARLRQDGVPLRHGVDGHGTGADAPSGL